ncbi:BRO-N domain-containing protein, partial [Histophilus somni]
LGLNRRSAETFNLNEKGCNNIATLTKGGEQIITFINEPNLYRIIFKSRKAEAVEFQNWVFEEVLPQIRKTGKYQLKPKQFALPEPEPT